ncbi:hypothetical protein Q9V03_000765 [Salmonella enterica]|nr:hypothetical protein [Salmonella enterica]ECO7735881.1 hypothetical protein [Salmonella enterica]EDZ7377421.1 hypothetical protein [Salmonella enterica]EEK5739149.1 hypothetical protein [Salmonella enterica]EEL9952951.1 hypothetical protein [Salmonella enterica]
MKKTLFAVLCSVFFVGNALAVNANRFSTEKEPFVYKCGSFYWKTNEEKIFPGYVSVAEDLTSFTIHNPATGESLSSGERKLEIIGDVRRYKSGAEVSMRNGKSYLKYREASNSYFKIGRGRDLPEETASGFLCNKVV